MSTSEDDFLEHHLDGLAVELVQIVEDKHLVHDLLGQIRVVAADGLDHRALNGGTHQVDHLGRCLHTTQRRLADLVAACQHLEQHFIQVLQGGRLNAFHGGHCAA